MQPADPSLRYLYAVWGFLEIAGFGGVIFGWGSLVYVFKDEGLYSHLCQNEATNVSVGYPEDALLNVTVGNVHLNTTAEDILLNTSDPIDTQIPHQTHPTCKAQDAMLNLVFSVTSSFYCLAAFAAGQINFKYGTRVTRLAATAVFFIGSMTIAFTTNDKPWLIFPGTCLVSAAGVTYFMTNVQISLLFPKAASMFIGLLVGGFEASAGTAEAIKLGYENGISRRTSFLALGICQLLTLVNTFFFLPKDFIKNPPEPDTPGTGSLQESIKKSKKLKKPKKLPSLRSLVLSPTYLLHLYWTAILQLRFMFVMSSLNVTLEILLHSKEKVSQYTNITAYILLLGIITAPAAGAFNDFQRKRFRGSLSPLRRKLMPTVLPLAVGTTLGVALSGTLLAATARVVCLVFVMLVIMRSFIYTLLSGLLVAVYPNEYYGFMLGIIMMVCGTVNLSQNALFAWASIAGFDQVNTFFLILAASTIVHPAYQWWAVRREKPSPTSLFTDGERDQLCTDSETNEYDAINSSSE